MPGKILITETIQGSVTPHELYRECQLFSSFKCENIIKVKNKLDPTYYEHIYPMMSKKETSISLDYPFK
jgi:vacuolar-type H+-ATPase subunit C/Vma6